MAIFNYLNNLGSIDKYGFFVVQNKKIKLKESAFIFFYFFISKYNCIFFSLGLQVGSDQKHFCYFTVIDLFFFLDYNNDALKQLLNRSDPSHL